MYTSADIDLRFDYEINLIKVETSSLQYSCKDVDIFLNLNLKRY